MLIRLLSCGLIGLFIFGSLQAFYGTFRYFNDAFAVESVRLDIGRFIKSHTSSESVLLVFDDDWSSAFAFHSERRSLTVPTWYKEVEGRKAFLAGSAEWLGGHPLGAVISKRLLTGDEVTALQGRCGAIKLVSYPDWNVYHCLNPGT